MTLADRTNFVCYTVEKVHPYWNGVGVRAMKLDRLLEFGFTEQDYHSMRMPITKCKRKGCKPYQLLVAGYTEKDLGSVFEAELVEAAVLASKGFGVEYLRSECGVSAQSLYDSGAFTLKEVFQYLETIPTRYVYGGMLIDNELKQKYENTFVVCRYAYPERYTIAKSPMRTFAEECKVLRFTYTPTECRKLGFSALKVCGLVPTSFPGMNFSELPKLVLSAGYTMTELIYGCPVDVLVLCVGKMRRRKGDFQIIWTNRIRHSVLQFLTRPKYNEIDEQNILQ
eukprot:g4325.t1